MNIRSLALAAVALIAISPAFADTPKAAPAEALPAVRAQALLEEIAAGMRGVLRAVVPEISLPALELKLPALDRSAR